MTDKDTDDGPPFEVELLLGGGLTVPFKLDAESLRTSRHPVVAGTARQGGRENLRAAAVSEAERALLKNEDQPVRVVDGGTLWVIPTRSIVALRFTDTTIKSERGGFGFSPDRIGD